MKKTLSILSIIAILSTLTPAVMAAPGPGGPGGPGRPGMHGAPMGPGMHHPGPGRPPMVAPPPRHRHHSGIAIGLGARHSYWSYPYCDYRVSYYDGFVRPCLPPPPPPRPTWGTSLFIGF